MSAEFKCRVRTSRRVYLWLLRFCSCRRPLALRIITAYRILHVASDRVADLGTWSLSSFGLARCVSVSVGFLLINVYSDENFTLPEARAVSDGSAWCVRVSVHLV